MKEWLKDSQEAVSSSAHSRKEWDEGHTEELETFYAKFHTLQGLSSLSGIKRELG